MLRGNPQNGIAPIVNYSVCGRDLLIAKNFFRFCCAVCKLNNFDGYILISLINSVTREVEVSFYWGTFTR